MKSCPCNIQRFFSAVKIENFLIKNDSFSYFCSKHRLCVHTNIDCEYPQSMFWSKNKKNRYTPANPSFVYKSGAQKGTHYTDMFRTCFVMIRNICVKFEKMTSMGQIGISLLLNEKHYFCFIHMIPK